MKNEIMKVIVKKAVNEGRTMGMTLMHLAPKTADKIVKAGTPVKNSQQLRSLITDYEDITYAIFLIDGETKNYLWGIWKIITKQLKYLGPVNDGKWIGFVQFGHSVE